MKLKMSMQIWSFHFSSKQIYIIQPVRTTRVQWNESTCYFFSDFLLDDNSGNVWKIQVWSILDKTGPKWPKNEVFTILFIISFWRLFGINSNKTYRTATTFLFRTHARHSRVHWSKSLPLQNFPDGLLVLSHLYFFIFWAKISFW